MSRTATTAPDRPLGFGRGLGDSVSLMLGYFPIAVSFGLLAVGQGLSPLQALLVSAVVYAGASQFTLVSLLAAGASPASVIGAVAAMNVRHLFYGPVLLSQLPRSGRRLPRPLLAFGLTDEVFALTSASITPRHGETWLLGVQMGAYGAWLAGTVTGAVAASIAGSGWPQVQAALAFVLPALFLALLLPMLRRNTLAPLMVAAVVAVFLSRFIPGHAALLAAMVLGAALAALLPDGEGAV